MTRMVEEIDLLPVVTQNQDDEVFNERKLHRQSDNIQNKRKNPYVFDR